jgi:ABC-2 type transport system ATP-binding protein
MCVRPARGTIAGMIEIRELIKDYGDTRELTERCRRDVFVRSPRRGGLSRMLTSMGATVLAEPSGGLSVTGMDAWRIAAAAAANYIPIQELTPRSASLEDSYLKLMNGSVEHRVHPQTAGAVR